MSGCEYELDINASRQDANGVDGASLRLFRDRIFDLWGGSQNCYFSICRQYGLVVIRGAPAKLSGPSLGANPLRLAGCPQKIVSSTFRGHGANVSGGTLITRRCLRSGYAKKFRLMANEFDVVTLNCTIAQRWLKMETMQ